MISPKSKLVYAGQSLTETCRYGRMAYWDARYAGAPSKPFEWYCDYDALRPILAKCFRPEKAEAGDDSGSQKRTVLVAGCGNSELSRRLAQEEEDDEPRGTDGSRTTLRRPYYSRVHSVDFSRVVVDKMETKYGEGGGGGAEDEGEEMQGGVSRGGSGGGGGDDREDDEGLGQGQGEGGDATGASAVMTWEQMDCLDMPLKDGEFDFVVDKGTMDCVLCSGDGVDARAERYVTEMERVLRTPLPPSETGKKGKKEGLEWEDRSPTTGILVVVSVFKPEKLLQYFENGDERSDGFKSFDCDVLTVPKPKATAGGGKKLAATTAAATEEKALLDDCYFVYVCSKDPVKARRKEEKKRLAAKKKEQRRMIKLSEISSKKRHLGSNLLNESELRVVLETAASSGK